MFLPPVLGHRDFRRLFIGLLGSQVATQMVSVAVGWQVFAIHRSAFDLGLIGLAEFVPVALLALPAGQLADRVPRVVLGAISTLAGAVVIALLLLVTLEGAHRLWAFVALAALTGAASAFGNPALRSLTPEVVPEELVTGALALRSLSSQGAQVAGPALGGLVFAVSPVAVYGLGLAIMLVSVAAILLVTPPAALPAPDEATPRLQSLLLGVKFVRESPIILGAISLDLFAVLFGGAVSLLPLFARQILHTGPFGLGVLRSATAIGAVFAGVLIARRPVGGRAGRTLLIVVGVFGASIVVFGLSHWFIVSFLALAVGGYADMYSMNIRATAVTLATPNPLRGRVNAVEGVFIGASNELGAFESGSAAALLGAVPAVVAGGAITMLLALTWGFLFKPLARVDHLEDVRPEEA